MDKNRHGLLEENLVNAERVPAAARKVAHLSAGERVARGKAARNEVPRSVTDAGSRPRTGRTPSSLLEEQGSEPGS